MLKKAILLLLALHPCIAKQARILRLRSAQEADVRGTHLPGVGILRNPGATAPSAGIVIQPSANGWDIFAKVRFKPQLIKEVNEHFLVPFFDSRIKFYEGKEMTLEGYYIPLDLESKYTIVLSRNPYAQCFFCGGAGPESVAEVVFASKPRKFKADEIITVTGVLKLNGKDINHMNFILENARLENN